MGDKTEKDLKEFLRKVIIKLPKLEKAEEWRKKGYCVRCGDPNPTVHKEHMSFCQRCTLQLMSQGEGFEARLEEEIRQGSEGPAIKALEDAKDYLRGYDSERQQQ